jgi:8-oxo-dGTP diphosphatase
VNGNDAKTHVYALFGRLPGWLRTFVIRRMSPNFCVGAMCVVRRQDGAVLLLRNSYRPGWGLPGGMLRRGEEAIDAVTREVREEVGVQVDIDATPRVVVDAAARRIDVVFTAHLSDASDADRVSAASPEVSEVAWFQPGLLPSPLHDEARDLLNELGVPLA